MAKLFLGGLTARTDEESLNEYFSRWGECIDIVVMRGRGFGFVTYSDPRAVNDAMAAAPHCIDGRPVDVRPADRRAENHLGRKIFICRVPNLITTDQLKARLTTICQESGIVSNVEEVKLFVGRNYENHSLRHGHVIFDNVDIVNHLCARGNISIRGVDVIIERPRGYNDQANMPQGRGGRQIVPYARYRPY